MFIFVSTVFISKKAKLFARLLIKFVLHMDKVLVLMAQFEGVLRNLKARNFIVEDDSSFGGPSSVKMDLLKETITENLCYTV